MELQKELKSLESNMAQLRNEKSKELKKIENEMDEETKKELKQKMDNHNELMDNKEKELGDLQAEKEKANEDLDKAKKDGQDKVKQQADEERKLREETVDKLGEDLKKKEEDWKRRLANKDARKKEEEENLKATMSDDLQYQKDQHEISKKSILYEHEKEVGTLTKDLSDKKKDLDAILAEKSQQMFDNENEIISKLADQKKQMEEKFLAEVKEKNLILNKEFEMQVEKLEKDHEQQLARVNQKKTSEEQKVIRANNMNNELGNDENFVHINYLFYANFIVYREEDKIVGEAGSREGC